MAEVKNMWTLSVGQSWQGLPTFLVRFELGEKVYMVYSQEFEDGMGCVKVKSHTDNTTVYEGVVKNIEDMAIEGELFEAVKEAINTGYDEWEKEFVGQRKEK